MIPVAEYFKTCIFLISGNDPNFIYDLLKSATLYALPIDVNGKAAIFTDTEMKMMILEMGAGII